MSPGGSHSHRELDNTIHSPIRLSIMATLSRMDDTEFQFLKNLLDVSDSLLSKHTSILESVGYIRIVKGYVHKRPTTHFSITAQGKEAYNEYITALQDIVQS